VVQEHDDKLAIMEARREKYANRHEKKKTGSRGRTEKTTYQTKQEGP